MQEEWKQILGYEGLYEISNTGLVKSLDRVKGVNGQRQTQKGRILKPAVNSSGYLTVRLGVGGEYTSKYIHRLVAEAFILNLYSKEQVNHINGIKTDNRTSNLEWVTSSENTKHAFNTGLSGSGRQSPHYKGDILAFNQRGDLVDILLGPKDMAQKGYTQSKVYECVQDSTKSYKGLYFKREGTNNA